MVTPQDSNAVPEKEKTIIDMINEDSDGYSEEEEAEDSGSEAATKDLVPSRQRMVRLSYDEPNTENAEITSLKVMLEEKTNEVNDLKKQINEANDKNLEEKLNEKVTDLKSTLSLKDDIIQRQNDEINELKTHIDSLKSKIETVSYTHLTLPTN